MVNCSCKEVGTVRFEPFVLGREHQRIPTSIELIRQTDAELTDLPPVWQTSWASTDEKEKAFIEEVTRVTYERDREKRQGLSVETIRPSFIA